MARSERQLIEDVWRASNLSWKQAEQIISEAKAIGKTEGSIEAYNTSLRLLRRVTSGKMN